MAEARKGPTEGSVRTHGAQYAADARRDLELFLGRLALRGAGLEGNRRKTILTSAADMLEAPRHWFREPDSEMGLLGRLPRVVTNVKDISPPIVDESAEHHEALIMSAAGLPDKKFAGEESYRLRRIARSIVDELVRELAGGGGARVAA